MMITKTAFEDDTKHMTHYNATTGAHALWKCAQRTHGIMMGSAYHILIQTPRNIPWVSPYTGDIYFANIEYINFDRGTKREKGEKWLKDNGFVAIR